MKIKIKIKHMLLVTFISILFANSGVALAEAAIDIVNDKAEHNKGNISKIETQTNDALSDLQSQITINTNNISNIGIIQGPQGEQGDQGIQGIQGIQGNDGAVGDQGPAGIDGLAPNIYYSQGMNDNGLDIGPLPTRTLVFTKEFNDSDIKITYSDNLRVLSNGSPAAASWRIFIDGIPTPIKTDIYSFTGSHINVHRATTIIGYIPSTDLGNGVHIITVHVEEIPGFPNSDSYTGWSNHQWLLETEEIFPR